jgi:perosamine synthetase
MAPINEIAKKHNLLVLDDSAEAHGAEYKGVKTGKLADMTIFSFFANKNLTTGEGGMVLTDNPDFYNKLKYFKNVCFPLNAPRIYEHNDIGFNYRMSNLHAAIGLAQVEKADFYRECRIHNAKLYKSKLSKIHGIEFQQDTQNSLNVHWMNAVLVSNRDEIIERLKNNEIETRLLFTGMHKQKALEDYGCDCSGQYPVSESLTSKGFYLPSASNLTEKEIDIIVASFSKP